MVLQVERQAWHKVVVMITISIIAIIVGSIIVGLLIRPLSSGKVLLMILGLLLITYGGMLFFVSKSPQAIDVYRGKTTLQITYKDSIPTDTTVVFK